MKKYLIGTCGHYDTQATIANGQTVKTITVTNELCVAIGEKNVKSISTHIFWKNPFHFFMSLVKLGITCRNIILFPDANAVKLLVPLMVLLKHLLRIKIYYVVIGGWLPETLKIKRWLLYFIKKLDGLFVETISLREALAELHIDKVHIFPNFKRIELISENDLKMHEDKPIQLCFFSRVIDKKGIEELIEAIKQINNSVQEPIYLLDIYGPVDPNYNTQFEQIKRNLPSYIQYCGVVESNKAVEVLKNYFLQVFPTKYKTEGYPGSIIDSYCAGVPVLASRWDSWVDIIDEGETGLTFEFGNFDDMRKKLSEIAANQERINGMKKNCIKKAKQLKPDNIMKILLDVVLGKDLKDEKLHAISIR